MTLCVLGEHQTEIEILKKVFNDMALFVPGFDSIQESDLIITSDLEFITPEIINKIEQINTNKALVYLSTLKVFSENSVIKLLNLQLKFKINLLHLPILANDAIEFTKQNTVILGTHKKDILTEYYEKLIQDFFIGAYNRKILSFTGIYRCSLINSMLFSHYYYGLNAIKSHMHFFTDSKTELDDLIKLVTCHL
jgi:hypothetical protein